jgi:hypothetical protein
MQALGLDTTPGAFQKTWSRAFTDYASTSAGHWHKAASGFSQLQSNYPNFKAITPYLNYAQDQAKNEQVPNGPISFGGISSSALAWTIGAITLIALLVLVIILLGFGRRGKKNAVVAPVAMGQGYPMQPGQMAPMNYGQVPLPPQQQNNNMYGFNNPPAPQPYNNGMSPFGGPQSSPTYPVPPYPGQVPSAQPTPIIPQDDRTIIGSRPQQGQQPFDNSGVLRPWPCGHLNRSNARFCSVCGEPNSMPPASQTFIRPVEQ